MYMKEVARVVSMDGVDFKATCDQLYDMQICIFRPVAVSTVFHINRTYVESNSDILYM